jgi:ABC-2 type transport system ATP-binding protein
MFDLAPKADETIASLSKGMKAKLAFAAAIIHEPSILILDEPLIGIDPAGQHLLKERLMAMARDGGTVLVSTHQLDTAERLCSRVAIVNHGRNIATGDLASLRQAAPAGGQESLEEIFLRLTQEATAPPLEAPSRRRWFRRG